VKDRLKNGDLVLIKSESLADHLKSDKHMGVVVDDIDNEEEVRVFHPTMPQQFSWWHPDCLEAIRN